MYKRLLATLSALMTLFVSVAAAEEPLQFQLHQISIGCADAYLILIGDIAIMIDGGNDTNKTPDAMMAYLRAAGFERLTAYIVTHYHDDHAGNLNLIMEEFGDEHTILYGPSETLPDKYLPLPCGQYRQMKDNEKLTIGALDIHCLGPQKLTENGGTNVDSLNFLITYGSRKFLFTGDYAHSGAYLEQYADVVRNVDVLKFPHHGLEPMYIGERTLRMVNPSIVLVPGAAAKAIAFVRKNDLDRATVYGNNYNNFIIYSDGQSLDVVTDVAPGQYAHKNIP